MAKSVFVERVDWLKRELRDYTNMCLEYNSGLVNHVWRCAHQLVLEYGTVYKYKAPASKYGKGRPKECYNNAASLTHKYPNLIYVEGFAFDPTVPHAFAHAWCVDPNDPRWAIEVTCSTFRVFIGLPFELSFARREWIRTRCPSLLDNWRDGYPLLNRTDFTDVICDWKPKGHPNETALFTANAADSGSRAELLSGDGQSATRRRARRQR